MCAHTGLITAIFAHLNSLPIEVFSGVCIFCTYIFFGTNFFIILYEVLLYAAFEWMNNILVFMLPLQWKPLRCNSFAPII